MSGKRKFSDDDALAVIDTFVEGLNYTETAWLHGMSNLTVRAMCRGFGCWASVHGLLTKHEREALAARVAEATNKPYVNKTFTDDEARSILRDILAGKTQHQIAKERGVTREVISQIAAGRTYNNVYREFDREAILAAGNVHIKEGIKRGHAKMRVRKLRTWKLTETEVAKIKGICDWCRQHPYVRGPSLTTIGKEFGVTREAIRLIYGGLIHRWIDPLPFDGREFADKQADPS
jgi:hypothetical protein